MIVLNSLRCLFPQQINYTLNNQSIENQNVTHRLGYDRINSAENSSSLAKIPRTTAYRNLSDIQQSEIPYENIFGPFEKSNQPNSEPPGSPVRSPSPRSHSPGPTDYFFFDLNHPHSKRPLKSPTSYLDSGFMEPNTNLSKVNITSLKELHQP